MKTITLLAAFCLILAPVFAQQVPQVLEFSNTEKGFLENKGQVKDLSGKVNEKVKFIYNNGLFNLELNKNGFSYELFQVIPDNTGMDEAGYNHDSDDEDNFNNRIAGSTRIDVVLQGANKNPIIEATNATGAYFNFYYSPIATNRIEGVLAYNTITYRNIYPGIDLVFSAPDKEEATPLHYDFVVHPGGNPYLIRLRYNGNQTISTNDNGSLKLNTSLGYIEEGKPFSYQRTEKEEVVSAYAVEKNEVKYQIGNYDKTQPLVIDPTLIWASYYGGEDIEDVAKVSSDKKDQPIFSGNTLSTFNIASSGAYQTNYGGQSDIFLAKFKGNGKLDWATYFGGVDKDLGYGAVADKFNDIVLYGKSGSDGLATIGQTLNGGAGDGLIVKFSAKGIFKWSTYKGSANDDHYRNVRCDKKGTIYAAGYTESKQNITTPGAYQTEYGGFGDCLLSKFSATGTEIFTTYLGALGSDRFHAVNLDLYNHILLQGTTGSTTGMATPGAYQTVFGGGEEDVLLAMFDTSGNRIWSTYYGGEFSDRGRGVESDIDGNIYIGGLTESEHGISTPGAHQEQWTPGFIGLVRQEDGYLAKFTPEGQLVWGTYYGGGGYDRIWGIALDREAQAVYVAGGTQSNDKIGTPLGWQPERIYGTDGFFARWDYDGNLVWGSYWGGKSEDHLQDIEPDGEGFVYALGVTNADRMPITLKVHQTDNAGKDEAMLYRFYAGSECYDYNEPNDDPTNARQIFGWAPLDSFYYGYTGSIVNAQDDDWFKLKLKSTANNFMIVLTDKPAAYNLKLYNNQQVLLQTSTNPQNMNDTLSYNGANPANYFIRISHGPNVFDSIFCYRLKVFISPIPFVLKESGNTFSASEQAITSLQVFPNPAADQLSFNITAPSAGNGSLMIYDMLGRLRYSKEVSLDEGYQTMNIPVMDLPNGSYQMLLKSINKNWVASFIKSGH
ncbi:MAG: T9SS type A sorting domain-containing protein [Chitinophagales bacterium]